MRLSLFKFASVFASPIVVHAIFRDGDGVEYFIPVIAWAVCHAFLPKLDETDPEIETTDVVGLITADGEAALIRVDDDGYQGEFLRYETPTARELAEL